MISNEPQPENIYFEARDLFNIYSENMLLPKKTQIKHLNMKFGKENNFKPFRCQ